jgi:glutathione synthase
MKRIAYVMDPMSTVNIHKDSTFAMMEAAQARGHINYYLQPQDLFFREGKVYGHMQAVTVERAEIFYHLEPSEVRPLSEVDAVIMRKDPPFNMDYIFSTYLLELAMHETLVMNNPISLRNANEKLYALQFPSLIPPTLISCRKDELKAFVQNKGKAILKPIDDKGGTGVFLVQAGDPNLNAIIDISTHSGQKMIVAQSYIPEAVHGDKRVLLVDGEVRGAFQRVPSQEDHRANLNAGGHAEACELTQRDLEICATLGPALKAAGLYFVGIDIIGDYLIEVNVTSPTGIQEAKKLSGVNIATDVIVIIENR